MCFPEECISGRFTIEADNNTDCLEEALLGAKKYNINSH